MDGTGSSVGGVGKLRQEAEAWRPNPPFPKEGFETLEIEAEDAVAFAE
jgi:hypothetical protein